MIDYDSIYCVSLHLHLVIQHLSECRRTVYEENGWLEESGQRGSFSNNTHTLILLSLHPSILHMLGQEPYGHYSPLPRIWTLLSLLTASKKFILQLINPSTEEIIVDCKLEMT